MVLEALLEALPGLGIGGVAALVVVVYERLRRLERVNDEVVRRLDERIARIERELDKLEEEVKRVNKLVAFVCARLNGGRECLND